MFRYLKLKVIFIGCAVDIVGSIIVALLILAGTTIVLRSQGMGLQEVQSLLSEPAHSFPLLIIILAGGMMADFVAGYITAKEAPVMELWHALFMILIVASLSLIGSRQSSGLIEATKILLGILAALSGAQIGKLRKWNPS